MARRADTAFTGNDRLIAANLEMKWHANVSSSGDLGYSSPIAVNGRVYLASSDASVCAFNLAPVRNYQFLVLNSGANQPLWAFKAGGPFYGSPAYAEVGGSGLAFGRLYVGSTDGNLYCLQAETSNANGSVIWSVALGNGVFSSPVVYTVGLKTLVVVSSNDGVIHALDASSGTPQWSFVTDDRAIGSPVFDSAYKQIYVPSYDGFLYALNAASGVLA